jgi:hypothetical protein
MPNPTPIHLLAYRDVSVQSSTPFAGSAGVSSAAMEAGLTASPTGSERLARDYRLEPHPLPGLEVPGGSCNIKLRKLPGAEQVRVVLKSGDATVFRAEVDVNEGLPKITLTLSREADGEGFKLHCHENAAVRLLLAKPQGPEAETPLDWTHPAASVDVAIIVDATARAFPSVVDTPASPGNKSESGEKLLLLANQNRGVWEAHVGTLCGFVEALRNAHDGCRLTVLAFGDQAMPANIAATDLKPKFRLYPEKIPQRLLQSLDSQTLRDRLLEIEPSSGGDYVDALADALDACEKLHWMPEARKLVLVIGDSPGYSILHPLRKGDACIREHDVDALALRLHRKGVALLTIYHQPPSDYLKGLTKEQRELQELAREQYRRLASVPAFALEASRFAGGGDAEGLLAHNDLIGRGGCHGIWVD